MTGKTQLVSKEIRNIRVLLTNSHIFMGDIRQETVGMPDIRISSVGNGPIEDPVQLAQTIGDVLEFRRRFAPEQCPSLIRPQG